MDYHRFIVDLSAGFKGFTQGVTYLEEGRELVNCSGYLYNNKGPDLTVAEYLKLPGHEAYTVVDNDTIDRLHGDHYKSLVGPAHKITKADFWEMLEVLPPENWTNDGGFEHFRMCEYFSGPITDQYGKLGDQYRSKRINVEDKSTWLTLEDFQ